MTIEELHYDFKVKIDKVDSLRKRNFQTHEIDWILNEAQLIFLKQRYGKNNNKQESFEETQKRKKDLRTLQVKSPEHQPGIVPVLSQNGVYHVNLSSLSFTPFIINNVFIDIEKNSCEKKIFDVKPITHDKINQYLILEYYKPSFIWERSFYVEAGNDTEGTLFFYTNNDFEIKKVYIEYLKLPKKVWAGNYNSLDGKYIIGQQAVTLEFAEGIQNEIVDLAVVECSRIIENPDYINLKTQKLQINE